MHDGLLSTVQSLIIIWISKLRRPKNYCWVTYNLTTNTPLLIQGKTMDENVSNMLYLFQTCNI